MITEDINIHHILRWFTFFSFWLGSKLAKKRKDAMGTTRQEMTHMVNAMDRSYADQSTLHAEDPLSITFMDSHNFSPRCK